MNPTTCRHAVNFICKTMRERAKETEAKFPRPVFRSAICWGPIVCSALGNKVSLAPGWHALTETHCSREGLEHFDKKQLKKCELFSFFIFSKQLFNSSHLFCWLLSSQLITSVLEREIFFISPVSINYSLIHPHTILFCIIERLIENIHIYFIHTQLWLHIYITCSFKSYYLFKVSLLFNTQIHLTNKSWQLPSNYYADTMLCAFTNTILTFTALLWRSIIPILQMRKQSQPFFFVPC